MTDARREWIKNLLNHLQSLHSTAVDVVASQCCSDGSFDSARFDLHQPSSYELAWASAELLAADSVLGVLDGQHTKLEERLALLFAVEASVSVIARLESLFVGFPDTADHMGYLKTLHEIAISENFVALRRECCSEAALMETGLLFSGAQGEFSDCGLSDHVVMARDAFRSFARDVVAPLAEAIHRENKTVPEMLLEPLREMGVFGLSIPERYSGIAPDEHDDNLMMVVVTEALSEASLGAAGSLITRPEILSRAILTGGTEQQKEQWLPKIAAGDPLCAVAFTEPDYGSDVAGLTLRATKCEGGWRLNGAKSWCTFAGKAGILLVLARTNPDRSLGHKGLSLFLVEKPSYEGVEFDYQPADGGGRLLGSAIPTIGYRGMHSFELAFQDLFVPDDHVVGGDAGLGKGFYFTMAGMVGGRLQTAGRALGIMRAALRASLVYAQERKIFGELLINFSLTRAKFSKLAARFFACRQLSYSIAEALNKGGGRVEASLAKLYACRSAEIVTREALQIQGGMGYSEESSVSRYFLDARVLSIFEGAEETLALKVISRNLIEQSIAGARKE